MPNNIIMADKPAWTTAGILQGQEPNGEITVDSITLVSYALTASSVTKFHGTNITLPAGARCFYGSSVQECFLQSNSNNQINGLFSFSSLKKIVLVVPNNTQANYSICDGCSSLEILDITGTSGFQVSSFRNCTALKTLVLRNTSKMGIMNATIFTNSTFASGGTGGTIYIPKTLYDHLGDGTSNDYKADSQWSTVDGYGTITWAKIEGSIYENAYADGTPIVSA